MARRVALAPVLARALVLVLLACAGGRMAAAESPPDPPKTAPSHRPDPPCPLETSERYEGPPIYEDDPVETPKKKTWEAKLGKEAASAAVRARIQGWPKALLADRPLPEDDRELARRVAADTWHGLDAFTDREHGLPLDNVRFLGPDVDLTTSQIGDYTNITNVGLHLIAVTAAFDLKLIDRAGAVERLERTLATLEALEQYQGFFFNYYDTTTLERTSNFISFVDTSWLTAGLIVVRNAFPEIAARATKLVDAMDYSFFYDPKIRQMSHGYFVHRKTRSRFHYGVFYTEARLGYLIAIGKGDAPPASWFEPVRIYPASCAGQTMMPSGTRWETIDGNELFTGHYEWKGVEYVPSWGGSMFEALMPTLVVDEKRHAPKSLGANDERHVLVQRRWAEEELGEKVWGMSPSSVPGRTGEGSYSEFGVRVLGMRGYKDGVVTPHASALAVGFAPSEAIANLRTLAERYPIYGDFGFYDGVDPKTGAVAQAYLALDQSMVMIALANYLTDGKVQQHFAADPIAQGFLPVLALESFFPESR